MRAKEAMRHAEKVNSLVHVAIECFRCTPKCLWLEYLSEYVFHSAYGYGSTRGEHLCIGWIYASGKYKYVPADCSFSS